MKLRTFQIVRAFHTGILARSTQTDINPNPPSPNPIPTMKEFIERTSGGGSMGRFELTHPRLQLLHRLGDFHGLDLLWGQEGVLEAKEMFKV